MISGHNSICRNTNIEDQMKSEGKTICELSKILIKLKGNIYQIFAINTFANQGTFRSGWTCSL